MGAGHSPKAGQGRTGLGRARGWRDRHPQTYYCRRVSLSTHCPLGPVLQVEPCCHPLRHFTDGEQRRALPGGTARSAGMRPLLPRCCLPGWPGVVRNSVPQALPLRTVHAGCRVQGAGGLPRASSCSLHSALLPATQKAGSPESATSTARGGCPGQAGE